ncbi:MAG TPA: EF-P beta-lysylation protein EpmB [Steroidobacteraceae bacterium]|nr:EF-P beta-lysylation protein EpmB [Steroidobacteraceae bacterium]
MLPRSVPARHLEPAGWQRALQACVTDPAALIEALRLGPEWLEPARKAAAKFPLRVPTSYLARMRRGDPYDPLLRQVLPLGAELGDAPGYVADPVGDLRALGGPGLLQKYHGRALLIASGTCAVHCRYCFRREFPYSGQNAARHAFAEALAAIRADTSIGEVLLSGGDPLTLGDRRLGALLRELDGIDHVRRVRIHTRLPVVLPERIDAGFLETWSPRLRVQRVIVLHANHANEVRDAPDVRAALARLRENGTALLNQSVLLAGVNDSVEALADLSERLFEHGALPYYLHVLDPVRGAAHFDVPELVARRLVAGLGERLPGYLVPRLVREVPGAPAKTMLPPASR